jgi:hypothetical protein
MNNTLPRYDSPQERAAMGKKTITQSKVTQKKIILEFLQR